ncbi:MAG: ABC transporter substrate-binding protein [Gammaproteobacteria bacterium]|jgi:NitT/TauT family transport system substrate-binding protein|nr:ABC transporter substrate-binding protein [Gammaproteobacteria bacterium]MBT7308139.1 ABC transporter substrate-binding protein [Gammaproteobacteria bacterium]
MLGKLSAGLLLLLLLPPYTLAEEVGEKGEPLESLVLQLRWITQAQFAGFYVALDKGFYRQHGLDVTILPGGPNRSPAENLQLGATDVSIDGLLDILLLRQKEGVRLINIAQLFLHSGYSLSCRRDHGIEQLSDLDGKRIGSWFAGDELMIMALLSSYGITAEIYPQNFNVNDLLEGRADCISTMRYNEYWQLLDRGMREEEIISFNFDTLGVSTLEDGLYVLESHLRLPRLRQRLVRFIAATLEGWYYTQQHPEEALEIILDNDPTGMLDEKHQRRMLGIVMELVYPEGEHLSSEQYQQLVGLRYQQTVDLLLERGVLRRAPPLAYTTSLWEEAVEQMH